MSNFCQSNTSHYYFTLFYILIFLLTRAEMFSRHKNSFLQSHNPGVNPRIVNRSVELARVNQYIHNSLGECDPFDFDPPFLRLASEQPCHPMVNLDATRRPLAFGRGAMKKIRRELHSHDQTVVEAAINSLCDIAHDPEQGYEAIHLRVPDRLADLMLHKDTTIRERVCIALTVLAGAADGKMAIVKNTIMLNNLKTLLDDVDGFVRHKAAVLIELIVTFWKAADELVDSSFIELLLDCVLKDDTEIIAMHLKSLESLMYFEDGKIIAFGHDGFNIFFHLIDDEDTAVVANALKCLGIMLDFPKGKLLALEMGLLAKLNVLIQHPETEIYNSAAFVLMFATLKMRAKLKAVEYPKIPERLVQLMQNWQNDTTQIYCIKALTNICEYPTIRLIVNRNYLKDLEEMFVRDDDLKRYKEKLIEIVSDISNLEQDK